MILAINNLAWMSLAVLSVSRPGPHKSFGRFIFQWSKLCETCPRIRQVSRAIDIPVIIDAFLLLDIQIRMSSSGNVNVLQWNREWFFSRRVKFDSGFNVTAVHEVTRHGPEVVYRFTGIRKWVLRLWKRPFWFSKKVNFTFSLNWTIPYRGGCSQFLISSRVFIRPSAIGKINSPCFGNITSFALSLFE